jgi:hypothetical protein
MIKEARRRPDYEAFAPESHIKDLLYGFIKALRPKMVLLTSCGDGNLVFKLATALIENKNDGHLQCSDESELNVNAVMQWNEDADMRFPVTVRKCLGVDLAKVIPSVDLAIVSSSGEASEVKLTDAGIIVLRPKDRMDVLNTRALRDWAGVFDLKDKFTVFQA